MSTGKTYAGSSHVRFEERGATSVTTPRCGPLYKCLVMLILSMGCLSADFAWGRQISVDLRAPVVATRVRTAAKLAAASSVKTDGTLRRVNLDAGAADVGEVAIGDELTFTLFDDVTITLTLKKKMASPLGGDVFLAEASGYEGMKNAVVLRTADGLMVDIQDSFSKKVYKIISRTTDVTVQELEARAGTCGCDALKPQKLTVKTAAKVQASNVANNSVYGGEDCIDILIAYDKNAMTWANTNGGGVTNFAETAVQKMNLVLANSGVSDAFQFRLVGIVCVEAATNDLQYVLDAATQGIDGWSLIKEKRDEVYADIVSVLIDSPNAGTTGLAWSLEATSLSAFSEQAYNVCSIQAVEEGNTMTHEVGHNMGAGHSDIQVTSPGPQCYSYSAGYYFSKGDTHYHTIMAYDRDGTSPWSYVPVPYFSTPEVTFEGIQVGDSTHDNAKTLLNTFAVVAAFRSPPNANEEDDTAMSIGCFFGFDWRTSKSRPWTNYDVKYPSTRFAAKLYSGDFRNFDGEDSSPNPSWDGPKPDTGSTWLETTVVGPVRMSFFHSVYMANGPFTISVDGEVKYSTRTSNTDTLLWADVEIPEGEHDVRLTFVSNGWFCGYDTFNGIEIYDVRTDTLETRPVITPASSYTEKNATTFWESCEVTITNAAPGTTIYYTLDDKWPNIEAATVYEKPLSKCFVYTGPFTVTNSVVVKAVAVQADGSLTMTVVSVLLQRHKVVAGEWTADAVGAVGSAAKDGKMVLVRYARSATKEFSGMDFATAAECKYVAATESEEFLSWAKNNGVYLVEYCSSYLLYTRPRRFEYVAAMQLYTALCSDTGGYPALAFSHAWMPHKGIGIVDLAEGAMFGSAVYDGTAASIIAILEQYIEERPQKCVTVTLDPGTVGELATANLSLTSGEKFGNLPVPQIRARASSDYRFIGWYANDNDEWLRREWYSDCYRYRRSFLVGENDIVPYCNVTLVAQWKYDCDSNESTSEGGSSSGDGSSSGGGSGDVRSAGMLNMDFARAQTVEGALYNNGKALVGTIQVKVGKVNKNGIVKVSASIALIIDGKVKKVTAKSMNLGVTTDGTMEGTLTFKAPIGEMMFEMDESGTFTLKNDSYTMTEATVGGALLGGSQGTFRLEEFGLDVPGEVQDGLLPYEEAFNVVGSRWQFAKNAAVKWAKPKKGAESPEIYDAASGKGLIVDDAKGKTNLASLKLTYAAKTGIFKGSFKAYALEGEGKATKLKKYTVNVIGVVVDGKGEGKASCKRPASGTWPVTVE